MANWRRKVEGLFEGLGWFLSKATDAKPPPPMEFVTSTGVVIPVDSPDIQDVLDPSALPEGVSFSTNNLSIYKMRENNWRAGIEVGARVVVCYDTGVGWVAARATVRLTQPEGSSR